MRSIIGWASRAQYVEHVTIRAVLFDWRGTLVVSPTPEEWVADGLRRAGRPHDAAIVSEIATRIRESNGDEDRMDAPGLDADVALHRAAFMEVFSDAGLDEELAEALYGSELDYASNRFANDAVLTIRALVRAGILIGVVSDIHFDIRPAFASVGLADAISSYSLSFEVGAQKPHPDIYDHALTSLGVAPQEAIMVGDRARPDGTAVEHGIVSLLLPPLRSTDDERLELVLKLAL
ncbi:HAD family hydrolase [Agromyces sp. Root81]|uniref:HAD family hydrolase n=1 Tax=Agromyces sp. Root81 TaxID=1736601 RepID=UPI00190FC2DC|nr:HAD family hydrolase [Agromyces sp. Root81]